MEELLLQISGLGVTGIIGGVLFKKLLDDDKLKNEERKEEAKYYREEIAKTREVYQEELRKDREIYIDSIEKITGRIDIIETDIKDIKGKLEK